jgi:hypothetical protein
MRATPADSTPLNGTGAVDVRVARVAPRDGVTVNGRSSNVFQLSHCGQRPSQRADSKPHAEQK